MSELTENNSSFVLRWEIDNAAARSATGRMESEAFDKGGFRWTAAVERSSWLLVSSHEMIDFILRCDLDNRRLWKCEGRVEIRILHVDGEFQCWRTGHFCLNGENCKWLDGSIYDWSQLTSSAFNINDKVTMEFYIRIISSDRGEPTVVTTKFASPNSMSNVVLKIGDEKLHVSKEYLAAHSPVFEALFFGDFAEKGKEEVELKDIVYHEFVDLLHVIYLYDMDITDYTVGHILKLADRFQMERVLNLSKKHLMQSKGLNMAKKLMIAEQFRLPSLRDHCLNSFTTFAELHAAWKSSPEYASLSEDNKSAVFDRVKELF